MIFDLLIRFFNLKFYKINNIFLVSISKFYCSKVFVLFVLLSCKVIEEFGIILSGMVKLIVIFFYFNWFDFL